MGLLAFPVTSDDGDPASGGLLNLAQPVSGVLAPPQARAIPVQQKWIDALGVISAALKDAGAYMQHRPDAANNVSDMLRRQNALQQLTPFQPMLSNLPPHVLVAALLNAAQRQVPGQAPNLPPARQAGTDGQPANP